MKIAVISDIHSNLEALQAFLADRDKYGWERVVCLGDIVGYGPNPNECVTLLQQEKIPCVLGNHDAMVIDLLTTDRASQVATEGVIWTKKHISGSAVDWLNTLPRMLHEEDMIFLHASVLSLEDYIRTPERAHHELKQILEHWPETRIAFYGHTHIQAFYDLNGSIRSVPVPDKHVRYDVQSNVYLVNPGAIGQSRTNRPRFNYAIYDRDNHALEMISLKYNHRLTRRKMNAVGLKSPLYRDPVRRFKRSVRKLLNL